MTNEEQLKAIIEKLKNKDIDMGEDLISCLVVVDYFSNLRELGFINSEFKTSPKGLDVVAVCNEFGWKPSDDYIKQFVTDMFPEETSDIQAELAFVAIKYRDDKEELISEFTKIKMENQSNPE